ncbi:hypothetical protein SERLA73DRAFT_136122, partial [Serpula lacrymans var. lacrymans S7.3]
KKPNEDIILGQQSRERTPHFQDALLVISHFYTSGNERTQYINPDRGASLKRGSELGSA